MIAASAYVVYTLNMWGPIMSVTSAMTDRAFEIGKEKLRQALEAPAHHQNHVTPIGVSTSVPGSIPGEDIPLEDLKSDSKDDEY
jgi:hypothetical protein